VDPAIVGTLSAKRKRGNHVDEFLWQQRWRFATAGNRKPNSIQLLQPNRTYVELVPIWYRAVYPDFAAFFEDSLRRDEGIGEHVTNLLALLWQIVGFGRFIRIPESIFQ
jgi:hypothetical protein